MHSAERLAETEAETGVTIAADSMPARRFLRDAEMRRESVVEKGRMMAFLRAFYPGLPGMRR